MINVQFDHQAFSFQRYGGISRYFAALSTYLKKSPDFEHELKVFYSANAYLSPQNSVLSQRLGGVFLEKHSASFLNRKYSAHLLSLNKFDVFHPTYYHPYFLTKIKKPFVITVHDMIHELFPEYFSIWDKSSSHKKKVIERADHIIAISEQTKNDLQAILNVADEKISVIHHGLFTELPVKKEITPYGPFEYEDTDYLLFVGSRKGYKNFSRFLEAAAPILHKHPSLSIICAGGGSFSEREQQKAAKLQVKDQIVQISATEQQLTELYRNALFFVYPSLYEGFGLPVLEAFHNHCPVLLSNASCFPEVGGNAVAYFNPLDVHDMHQVMQTLVDSADDRTKLIQAGMARLSAFSTERCMEKTAAVYRYLA